MANYGPPDGRYSGRPDPSDDPWSRDDPYREPRPGSPYRDEPYRDDSYRDKPYRDKPYRDEPYRDDRYRDDPYRSDPHGNDPHGNDERWNAATPYEPYDRYPPEDSPRQPDRFGPDPYARQEQYSPYGGPEADRYPPAPPPAVDEPAPPRSKSSTTLVVVLISVLVFVLCGAGVGALIIFGRGGSTPAAKPSSPAQVGKPSPSVSTSPSYDPTTIIRGQCVVNDSTNNDDPRLRVVTCGPGTYQVLARFDGTKDTAKCDTVAGSTHNYFYDTTPDTLDFVLCLKKQ